MKILNPIQNNPNRHRQGGMAVIVVLALLALILIYVAANLRALSSLEGEIRLVEKRQIRRLEKFGATNRVVVPVPPGATNAVPNAGPATP